MAKTGKYIYDWPRPMLATDIAVFGFFSGKVKLLFIERKNEPFKGKWALPGGFVNIDEEVENAAARELEEETGLTGLKLEQMHTFSRVGRDPRGRVVTILFMGIVQKGKKNLKAGDDAAKVRWFDIEKLPEGLAFDHKEVTGFVIEKLKRRKVYRLRTFK